MSVEADNIPVDCCRPSPAAREVKPIQVEMLARSIEQVGLIQPIVVRRAGEMGEFYEVIAGMHRLTAFKQLGRQEIAAIIRTDDDLHAELALIDENLIRNELSPAERALAISRRKAIYETLHPETRQHVAGGKARQKSASDNLSFAESTAQTTGKNRRTIERDAHRGETLGEQTLKTVTGTSLDTGEELDALAKLSPDHRERIIAKAAAGEEVSARRGDAALPNGSRAIMGSRVEPDDSLDYFPTPPWATRALIEIALRQVGRSADCKRRTAWEPACGEGHIAEVLAEYFRRVVATDIHDYGYHDGEPVDFLSDDLKSNGPEWIITNPPFNDKAEAFTLRALDLATVGVAMFVRQQWLEGGTRYKTIFQPHPPALIVQFSERVPLCKGRWDPDGSTATSYVWIVWLKGHEGPTKFFWLPPTCRELLSRPDDRARFTTRPVTKSVRPTDASGAPLDHDPSDGEITEPEAERGAAASEVQAEPVAATPQPAKSIAEALHRPGAIVPVSDDQLDIPAFLRRKVGGGFVDPSAPVPVSVASPRIDESQSIGGEVG